MGEEDFAEDFLDENYEDLEVNEDDEIAALQMMEHHDLSNKMYCRPPVDPTIINQQTDIYFMQLDCDYYIVNSKKNDELSSKAVDSR